MKNKTVGFSFITDNEIELKINLPTPNNTNQSNEFNLEFSVNFYDINNSKYYNIYDDFNLYSMNNYRPNITYVTKYKIRTPLLNGNGNENITVNFKNISNSYDVSVVCLIKDKNGDFIDLLFYSGFSLTQGRAKPVSELRERLWVFVAVAVIFGLLIFGVVQICRDKEVKFVRNEDLKRDVENINKMNLDKVADEKLDDKEKKILEEGEES